VEVDAAIVVDEAYGNHIGLSIDAREPSPIDPPSRLDSIRHPIRGALKIYEEPV